MSCKSRFLVTEEDKKHILSLYNILNEEVQGEKTLTIQSQNFFDNGKWMELSLEGSKQLNDELNKVEKFLIDNKGSVVNVKIIAGESQVTNYDWEVSPPKQVDIGFLAQKRAETIKNKLNVYFDKLISNGNITNKPIFKEPEIVVGKTSYKKGVDNPNDPKYDKERFVRVELSLVSKGECLVGLTVEVLYNSRIDSNFPCRGNHQCDEAKFNVKLNGVIIGVADLNNASDGGSRSFKKDIDTELAKEIMDSSQSEQLSLSLQCLESKCHSSTPEVRISKNESVLFSGCVPSITKRNDATEKVLMVLDKCGNVLTIGEEKPPILIDITKVYPNANNLKYFEKQVEIKNMVSLGKGKYRVLKLIDIPEFGIYKPDTIIQIPN
jgi:hypothetical protein